MKITSAFVLGIFIFLGFGSLGFLLGKTAITYKSYERTVTVKGLAETEHPADIVIWPIKFTSGSNDLTELYQTLQENTDKVLRFLNSHGVKEEEVTISPPAITDKWAQKYGNNENNEFRYAATQTITLYSHEVDKVRKIMNNLIELGKEGIVFVIDEYNAQIDYIFTQLNELKPKMIEEATKNAREVAQKFAKDSDSQLGKIKRASQGQFSITPRDKNTPYIKKIRVVSTVEYYLSD